MRALLPILVLITAPLIAFAAGYSSAPMVVIGDDKPVANAPAPTTPTAAPVPAATPTTAAPAPTTVPAQALLRNFPETAITRVGENTGGQHFDSPANPSAPANPPAPAPGTTPANPTPPAAPANPISKLWPRDTVQIFMPPCVGFHPTELAQPCLCVITKLMTTMPHDEFLAKSESGTIEQDQRLLNIRQECATAPKRKD